MESEQVAVFITLALVSQPERAKCHQELTAT